LIASLDSSTGVVVLEALESANRELGTTTVIITHNADIQGMADRVMHVHDGLIDKVEENATKKAARELSW
jgi:putative ABC transport system ATP-binding protein